MRILLDQGTPVPLRRFFPGHQVSTAYAEGWANFQNGDLLAAGEGRFDLFITTDKNLRYQQDLQGRTLAILVLPTTRTQCHCLALRETIIVQPSMSYRESLPEGCPPDAAEETAVPREVFRLVRNHPPTLEDFRSQRAEKPNAIFHVTECQARGLSVFAERRDAADKALKLPRFRGCLVCRVTLQPGAGRIQQTFQPSHHTWWPLAAFDILAHCGVEVS